MLPADMLIRLSKAFLLALPFAAPVSASDAELKALGYQENRGLQSTQIIEVRVKDYFHASKETFGDHLHRVASAGEAKAKFKAGAGYDVLDVQMLRMDRRPTRPGPSSTTVLPQTYRLFFIVETAPRLIYQGHGFSPVRNRSF